MTNKKSFAKNRKKKNFLRFLPRFLPKFDDLTRINSVKFCSQHKIISRILNFLFPKNSFNYNL